MRRVLTAADVRGPFVTIPGSGFAQTFIGILAASGAFYLLKHYLQLGPAAIFFWVPLPWG